MIALLPLQAFAATHPVYSAQSRYQRQRYGARVTGHCATLGAAARIAAFERLIHACVPKTTAAGSAAPAAAAGAQLSLPLSHGELERKLIASVAQAADANQLAAQLLQRLQAHPHTLQHLAVVNAGMQSELQGLPVPGWAHAVPATNTHATIAAFLRSQQRSQTFAGVKGIIEARRIAAQAVGASVRGSMNQYANAACRATASGTGNNARVTVEKLAPVVLQPPGAARLPSRAQMLWVHHGWRRLYPNGVPSAQPAAAAGADRAQQAVTAPAAAQATVPSSEAQRTAQGASIASAPAPAAAAAAAGHASAVRDVTNLPAGAGLAPHTARRARPEDGTAQVQPARKAAKTSACVDLCSP